jgi:Fe/S biogenesis protein NfuA
VGTDHTHADGEEPAPIVTITGPAREKVREVRAGEREPKRLALWIEVSGVSGANYTYDMWFQALDDAGPGEVAQDHDDLAVVVSKASVEQLRGATLDLSPEGGMVIVNPNSPSPPMRAFTPDADLSGDVAQRVVQVLELQINPSIAAHGGFAELVAVEEDTAFLRLSGGCQGCGLASVTLSQGIEVAIRESVPEIARVVDVTDHASGTNPYYEAAKK